MLRSPSTPSFAVKLILSRSLYLPEAHSFIYSFIGTRSFHCNVLYWKSPNGSFLVLCEFTEAWLHAVKVMAFHGRSLESRAFTKTDSNSLCKVTTSKAKNFKIN